METQQKRAQRLTLRALVNFVPVIALVCFAAFAAVPINAQGSTEPSNCGWDTDEDADHDSEGNTSDTTPDTRDATQDFVWFKGGGDDAPNLLNFISSGCAQSSTVQLRIYKGHNVPDQPTRNAHIRLPQTGNLNLGPGSVAAGAATAPTGNGKWNSVQLQIIGEHPNRKIALSEADFIANGLDSNTTYGSAWLEAPLKYTIRALSIESDDLGEVKITVVIHKSKLAPPTNLQAVGVSPTNIFLKWDGAQPETVSDAYGYDYQVRYTKVAGATLGTPVISSPIDDNRQPVADGRRLHEHTLSGLKANTAYRIAIRSYKKTNANNDYDIQVSDWVYATFDSVFGLDLPGSGDSEDLTVKTTKLYSTGDKLSVRDGTRSQFLLMQVPSPQTTPPSYTWFRFLNHAGTKSLIGALTNAHIEVDVDSGNDALFSAEHITASNALSDDLVLIIGKSAGTANLSIEVTVTIPGSSPARTHVFSLTAKVQIGENAAPMFTISSVSLDWNIESNPGDFEINVKSQFVSGTIDADDQDELEFSMTGGEYRGTTFLEIDEDTGKITVPDDVTTSDYNKLSSGHEFELVVTATDPADQSDNMTIFVDVLDGATDRPFRTTGSSDSVWLVPLASATRGGTKRTDITKSFTNRDGGQLCYKIKQEGFTVSGTDQTSNITINNTSIDVDTVADFTLTGSTACPRGQVNVAMKMPSNDPSSDQFALVGYYGVITVWASVTAYQRGDKTAEANNPVKVRIDLMYGVNSAPTIRTVAKLTNGNTYYATSSYSIDEGSDINLTFTADDPSPSGDRLCWSQKNDCTPCKGAENKEVRRPANTGALVTEDRASDRVSNISHEYDLKIVGTEHIAGSNVRRVVTDYESNPGGYQINLCATDLAGATHKLRFVVRIENVEEPPVIQNIADMYFLVGDYAQTVDLNEVTVDGDGASDIVDFGASIVGTSTAVTVSESNGVVTVTPTEDDVTGTQTVEIEVSATDSSGTTIYESFYAYVKTSNNSPRFVGGVTAQSYEIPENSKVGTNVGTATAATDSDPDDTITYDLSGGDGYFSVQTTSNGGQIKVKKAGLDYEGSKNVFKMVLTASDNYGSAAALNITVSLTDVNEPPRATDEVIPDQRILVGVTKCIIKASEHFIDPDAGATTNSLTIGASSNRPGEVSVEVIDNDDVCITGESVGSASARITVTATDSDNTTVRKRFRATSEQNNPPTVVGDGVPDQEVQFDGRSDDIDLNVHFNDGDANYDEKLEYSISDYDTGIVTAVVRKEHYLRIYGDEAGKTSITVTATDQNDQSVKHTLDVEVVRNDPPIPHPDAIADVTTRLGLTVDPIDASGAFTDEGDTFDLDIKTDDADIATAAIDYDDNSNPWINIYLHSTGVTKATLKATDTAGNSAEVSFSIDVGARNDPPRLVNEIDDQTVEVDDRVDVDLEDVFEDEGELTYEIDNEDDDVADVIYRARSNELRIYGNQVGTTDVTVTVYDNLDQTASDTFTVTVTDPPPANSAPTLVAQLDDMTVTVGTPGLVSIQGNFSDPDGDELAYMIESDDPNIVRVTLDEMDVTMTGIAYGTATIRLTATDPEGLDVVDVFKIYVETAPQVVKQIEDVTLQIGGDSMALNIAEYFTDSDGDTLTYAFTFEGSAAVASFDGSTVSLAPSVLGTTKVTVTATDSAGRSASQSFNAIVSNSELKAAGTEALSSVGRQIISSVSNAIGTRVENKDTERNLFSRVIGGKSRKEERAVAETPTQSQPVPQPTKPEPVFDQSTSAPAPKTTNRTRDVFSTVISPRNFASMKLRDLVPENFSTSLTGPNLRYSLSIWGTTDQQQASSSLYDTSSSSTYVGVDIRPMKNLMLGISVSENTAESDYSWGTAERQLQTDLTSILPYASLQITPNTLVWGTVGVGSGEASILDGDNVVDQSSLSLRLGHVAFKSQIRQLQQFDLAVKGDVSLANLATSNGEGEASSLETSIDRVRLGLAGSYAIPLNWGGSFTPFGELAYRRDGGDGATGSGIEFVGGLRIASRMFSVDARGHTMATYSENDYKESGLSFLAVFNPTPGEQGLSLSFTPSWGQSTRTETTLWRESATVSQLPYDVGLGTGQGMMFNTNISYGFLINHDQHMFKPYIEYSENAQKLRSILFGAELKPLVLDTALFNLNIVLGRVDESSEKSESHLGVNALFKF